MRSFVFAIILALVIIGVAVLPGFGVVSTSAQTSDSARRITPADLRELIKKNQAILVDVRSGEAYKAGHIKGARSIPYSEIASRSGELPKDKLIATYCSWPAEHTSAGAVLQLNSKGIQNAAAVLGGYDGLVKAGFGTETGD